jgi:hypothetical protein
MMTRSWDFRRDDEPRGHSPFAHLFCPQPHPAVEGAPPIRLFASQVFTIVLPINISILSLVALEGYTPVHLFSSFIFFLGCILNFFLSDNLTVACGFAVSTLSWLSLALFFAHMFTIEAVLQYGVGLVIFLKIAMFRNGVSPHSVKLNREKGE